MKDDKDLVIVIIGILGALIALTASLRKANAEVTDQSDADFPPIPGRKPAPPSLSSLDVLYQKHGNLKQLDWLLIKSIARVESSERIGAINPNDPSYGLMQILCTGGGNNFNAKCSNNFPAIPRWNEATRNKLLTDPDFNVHVGASILKWNMSRYGFLRGIATYNAWGARNDPANGPFRNQNYVDKVMREYTALGGSPQGA